MKQTEIERLLPTVFQRTLTPGSPLAGLLDVMAQLHQPSETVLAQFEAILDPYQAPPAFVPFIASWLDLERFFTQQPEKLDTTTAERLFATGSGRLRELTADAAFLSKWRGTAKGLTRFLETATGVPGFVVEEQIRPFHIRIQAPEAALIYRPLIERIIELEKPAYVTYALDFGLESSQPTEEQKNGT